MTSRACAGVSNSSCQVADREFHQRSAGAQLRDTSERTGAHELSLVATSARRAEPELPSSHSGSFRFVDAGHITNHRLVLSTARAHATTRIVFVMHGSESQTARQACDLASAHVQTLDAIVLAPQFSEEHYPGDAYMFGNMIDSAGTRSESEWALTAIEQLSMSFVMKWDQSNRLQHRWILRRCAIRPSPVLFLPEARFRRAVAASAGRYAFPSWSEKFPYGLAGSPIDRTGLAVAFSRQLWCYSAIGISPTGHRTGAMAQGTTRFAQRLAVLCNGDDEAAALGVYPSLELRMSGGPFTSANGPHFA